MKRIFAAFALLCCTFSAWGQWLPQPIGPSGTKYECYNGFQASSLSLCLESLGQDVLQGLPTTSFVKPAQVSYPIANGFPWRPIFQYVRSWGIIPTRPTGFPTGSPDAQPEGYDAPTLCVNLGGYEHDAVGLSTDPPILVSIDPETGLGIYTPGAGEYSNMPAPDGYLGLMPAGWTCRFIPNLQDAQLGQNTVVNGAGNPATNSEYANDTSNLCGGLANYVLSGNAPAWVAGFLAAHGGSLLTSQPVAYPSPWPLCVPLTGGLNPPPKICGPGDSGPDGSGNCTHLCKPYMTGVGIPVWAKNNSVQWPWVITDTLEFGYQDPSGCPPSSTWTGVVAYASAAATACPGNSTSDGAGGCTCGTDMYWNGSSCQPPQPTQPIHAYIPAHAGGGNTQGLDSPARPSAYTQTTGTNAFYTGSTDTSYTITVTGAVTVGSTGTITVVDPPVGGGGGTGTGQQFAGVADIYVAPILRDSAVVNGIHTLIPTTWTQTFVADPSNVSKLPMHQWTASIPKGTLQVGHLYYLNVTYNTTTFLTYTSMCPTCLPAPGIVEAPANFKIDITNP